VERKYESMMIIRPDLTEEGNEEVFQKIIKRIETLEGKVSDSKVWIKERKFYFPLRSRGAEKKKYHKGAYWLVNFNLDTTKLTDLKETIRLEENILRNIIIKKEK
jgi:ribosomal protein S6